MHLRLMSGLVVLATLVASLSHPVGNHSHRQCGGYGGFRRQCCGKDRWFVEGVMLVIAEEEQRYGALVTTDFTKADAENRPIRAARLQKGILAGDGIGVAGWVKEKRREI